MEGRVRVMAALPLLLVAVTTAAAAVSRPGSSDPCSRHSCPPGEDCVSHEVTCRRPPCPRISECRAANCSLPCLAGFECAHRPRPCRQPPCPTREECVPAPDACQGRCLPDELCLTSVKRPPCERPPCSESVCVPQAFSLTARHQPPPPSFCQDCPSPAVCVPTQVCRQYNECLFLPVCLTNCTAMWCGQGHECRMQPPARCDRAECPLEPACVAEEQLSQAAEPPPFELGNRFDSRPREPQCVVQCTEEEECRFMQMRCMEPPCPIVSRCVPRSRPVTAVASASAGPPPGGECPLDDLRQLASPAFCGSDSLHQCAADGECGPQRRCCDRGCGRSCLPTCRPGCRPGTECRLVAVQCIGSPCPKVAQCVAAEPSSLPPPPPPEVAASQARPAPSFEQRPAAAASASAGPAGAAASSASSSSSSSSAAAADAPAFIRPGLCPVNDRQTQSRICFDNGSVDQCANDGSCPSGQRCCLRGCQRLCRPVCPSCRAGRQCRLTSRGPVCLPATERSRRRG